MSSRVLLSVFLATILLDGAVLPQSQPPRLSARELFYTSPATKKPQDEKPAARPLGLRYSIQKEDRGGTFSEIDADTVFVTGDHIKLTVEANESGYLYIVQQGASGRWRVLFPLDQSAGRGNRIEKNRRQEIPQEAYFNFSDPAGDEKLFVVLSREPEADWDKLIGSVGGPGASPKAAEPASIDNAFIDRAKQSLSSRDLVYE